MRAGGAAPGKRAVEERSVSGDAGNGVDDGGNGVDGGDGVALPLVRRIEALGFRAWPAANSLYDGSWLVRLTAGHPSRRLNSVNALDRMDDRELDARIGRIAGRFAAFDRGIVFRQTPLAPPALGEWLDARGFSREGETLVMTAAAADLPLHDAREQIPLQDVGLFVEAVLDVRGASRGLKSGLTEVLSAIRPPKGMFVISDGDRPVATALAVHDGEFAGVFEVATREIRRRTGMGRAVTTAALRWAASRGATRAWLQVEADNEPALGLYGGLGFKEAYRYHYRAAPGEAPPLAQSEELI